MTTSNLPAADSQILATFANLLDVSCEAVSTSVLQAKSALANSSTLQKVGAVLDKLTWQNFIASLKIVGGIVALAEGLSILGNAAALGSAAVQIAGLGAMAPAMAAIIGVGAAVLGAYLLYKGLDVLRPIVTARLRSEFGSAWDVLWGNVPDADPFAIEY